MEFLLRKILAWVCIEIIDGGNRRHRCIDVVLIEVMNSREDWSSSELLLQIGYRVLIRQSQERCSRHNSIRRYGRNVV